MRLVLIPRDRCSYADIIRVSCSNSSVIIALIHQFVNAIFLQLKIRDEVTGFYRPSSLDADIRRTIHFVYKYINPDISALMKYSSVRINKGYCSRTYVRTPSNNSSHTRSLGMGCSSTRENQRFEAVTCSLPSVWRKFSFVWKRWQGHATEMRRKLKTLEILYENFKLKICSPYKKLMCSCRIATFSYPFVSPKSEIHKLCHSIWHTISTRNTRDFDVFHFTVFRHATNWPISSYLCTLAYDAQRASVQFVE